MSAFGRKSRNQTRPKEQTAPPADDPVKDFLRGQNMEQVGKLEDAIALYERAVANRFDSAGPYDRLILIYGSRMMHAEVIRIAELSLEAVHTYDQKKNWYQQQIDAAKVSMEQGPIKG